MGQGKKSNAVATIALVLAIIAIVAVIIIVIFWLIDRNNIVNDNTWQLSNGKKDISTDNFTAVANGLYMCGNTNTAISLSIVAPSGSYVNGIFTLNNTSNSKDMTVLGATTTGAAVTVTDNVGSGTIDANSSGTYVWTGNLAVTRLY